MTGRLQKTGRTKMGRSRRGQAVSGWLILDKPLGLTSIQAVGRIRRVYDPQKIGHGGTLDPLATGLLPIALGEATKTVPYVMDGRKAYRFTLRWGQATTTDDGEGAIVEESAVRPTEDEIRAVLPQFIGEIQQEPPIFSAIKVNGKRAYDMARAAQDFKLAARPVTIHRLELVSSANAEADADHAIFDVGCGKGTYMRSLGRDLGRALGTCAFVTALRRTAVGPFTESHSISLESVEALGHSAAALEQLLPVETALDDIPALVLSEAEANRLRCGQAVSMLARANRERIQELKNGAVIFATSGGKPVALARYEAGDIHPVRVLNL